MQATRPQDIQTWLGALKQFLTTGTIPAPGFLKPYHFVTLGLRLKEQRPQSLQLPAAIASYAARMRLWEALDLACPFPVDPYVDGTRACPIERLTDADQVEHLAVKITNLLVQAAHVNEETAQSIQIALTELISNCHDHSRSRDGLFGLACAQTWYRGRRAQIAIADSGIGIRQSLSENLSLLGRLADENSCDMATQYGVSSKPQQGHKGYGLTLARDLAQSTTGSFLYLQSYGEALAIRNRKLYQWDEVHATFPGTLVVFEWHMDEPLEVTQVYGSWPAAEGDYDDYF